MLTAMTPSPPTILADYRYVRRERNSFDPFLLTYVPPNRDVLTVEV